MPLPVRVTPPPPPPPPPAPPERIRLTWIAPDGTEWDLTRPAQTGYNALASNLLAASTPIEITTDDNPRGGVAIRHSQPLGRVLVLPIRVRGRGQADFVARWRALEDAICQTTWRGPGILRVRRPDGSEREIGAVYESGFDGEPEHGVGVNWDNAVVALVSQSPYWRDPQPVRVRREETETADFYDPFMSISSGQVLGATTINNPGQVPAWPLWRLTGPLSQFTATNEDTGESFTFDPDWDDDGALGVGEVATIQTDPLRVRGPAGEIWTGAIDFPTGVLWPLRRGSNRVTFTAAGATDGTAVELEFHPLYRTA